MNRDEQDWINALNATGNLANTLAKTEAQGLQIDAYLKEKADKEKQAAVANWATTGISRGLDPNQLNKFESVPTNQAAWDSNYKDMNRGLKPGTSGYVAPENFSMSSDVKAGSAEIQTGVNEAMKRNVEAYKADFEMKKNKVAPIIKSLPMDKLNTIDFEQFGDNAEAARAVFAEDIKTRSESAQYKKQFDDTIRAGIEQHWKGWSSSVGLAEESIKKGNRVAAMAYANTAINVHNSDSRKFEVNPETGTSGRFYIIQQGKKSYDDKEYAVEDVLKMMKEITPQQFNEHNWTTAKETQTFNGTSAKDPVILFNENTGKILSAVAEKDPITSAMTWVVHDKGKPIYRGDLQKIYDLGYVSSDGKEKIDANTRRGLAIEGDREQIKTEKLRRSLINEQIKKAAAGGSDSGKINVNDLKFFGKEFNKQVVSKMGGLGANIAEDDMGILKSGAPLDEKQKVVIENIGLSKGLVAALSPNESGGYNFHGFYTPDAAAEPDGGGKNYVNENMAKLTAQEGGEKKGGVGLKSLIVPMGREPGAEKLAQGIKKTVERVDRAFSGDSGKSNQVKLDKLKKELVKHPNDESLRNRISQLEKAMGK